MADISREQRVLSLVTNKPGLLVTMETLLEQLHRCQKALNEFLEEKRSAFPRFYFIGDDDLLEILGQATQPVVIQSHLKKLFAGIHTVVFSEEGKEIVAMKSLEGERVNLVHPVTVTTEVEVCQFSPPPPPPPPPPPSPPPSLPPPPPPPPPVLPPPPPPPLPPLPLLSYTYTCTCNILRTPFSALLSPGVAAASLR